MSGVVVDPALFRLRVFEDEWIDPLIELAATGSPLDAILLVEAERWLVLGRAVGYFADRPLRRELPDPGPPSSAEAITRWIRSRPAAPSFDAVAFERALSEAREDLTPHRRELLRLVAFASDDAWHEAIDGLLDCAGGIHPKRTAALPPARCESVAWVLEGMRSEVDHQPLDLELPAGWRLGSLAKLGACSAIARGRLATTADARATLARCLLDLYERLIDEDARQAKAKEDRRRAKAKEHRRRGWTRDALEPVRYALGRPRGFDPLTAIGTGMPTEPLGALPQPSSLLAAYAAYEAGTISMRALEHRHDAAVREAITRQEEIDQPVNSLGDPPRPPLATYSMADAFAETALASGKGPSGQFHAMFAGAAPYCNPRPTLDSDARRYEALSRSVEYAQAPLKQAVVAPSMLALLYPTDDPIDGYSREQFEEDVVQECAAEIRKAFDAGAARVSIDCTESGLATCRHPHDPWTSSGLPRVIELNNRVLACFSEEQRARIGVQTSAGATRTTGTEETVPYRDLLPEMFKINAGYFLIQLASERDKDPIFESIGQYSGDDQMCYLGVTVTQSLRAESPHEICDMLIRAADFIPKERIGSTDDCGPLPGAKPRRWSPDFERELAFQKIAARVEGTRMAAARLGISID